MISAEILDQLFAVEPFGPALRNLLTKGFRGRVGFVFKVSGRRVREELEKIGGFRFPTGYFPT